MNTKNLIREQIVIKTKALVKEERHLTAEILASLEKIYLERIYLAYNCTSLFVFCVKELGYSEPSAQRRVEAVKLSCDVPEVKTWIGAGELQLTNVANAQSFFKHEKKSRQVTYSPEQKKQILEDLKNTSTRQCEKYLAALSPIPMLQEKVKPVSATETQISFTVTDDVLEKFKSIKSKWAHKNPNFTYSELFEALADFALAKESPTAPKKRALPAQKPTQTIKKDTRHIPEKTRREIWIRDAGRCTYRNPITKEVCDSTYALELDHIQPRALGGGNEKENLRLLCRTHNLSRARETFGIYERSTYA